MIRHYPDPVLLKPAAPVTVFNGDLKTVVENLFRILKISRGVGLAAPQIGVPLQIAVIEVPATEAAPAESLVLVNPEIVFSSYERVLSEEGCLSVPGVSAIIERHNRVEVKAQNVEGGWFERHATGLMSAAIQHETDHLQGRFFFDHLGPVKRELLLTKYRKTIKRFHRRNF